MRRLLLGAFIAQSASSGWALTLGRASSLALIGRPLEASVAVTLDAAADGQDLCAEAEVFYGDTRVDDSRVNVQLVPAGGDNAILRIRSLAGVNEPVVTLYVRIGCAQRFARRYVLLSEQPVDAADQRAPAIVAPRAEQAPRAAPAAAAAGPRQPAGGAGPAQAAAAQSGEASAASRQRPSERATARAERQRAAAPSAQARLKLDPIDLRIERDPVLKLTASLDSAGNATPQQRAEAAALWQALNAQPEDLLRNTQRLQSLEGDIRSLRESMLKNDATLTGVRAQLEKAERERYANGVVYGLLALVLASALLAGFLWWRGKQRGSQSQWWQGRGGAEDHGFDGDPDLAVPAVLSEPPDQPAGAQDVDVDLGAATPPSQRTQRIVPLPPDSGRSSGFSRSGFSHSMRGEAERAIKAEELSDIQQEADFFVSLGEHGRAIEVLRAHIEAHPQASAVAWLDLLEIHHKLQHRDEYEQVRRDFEWLLNAHAPAFDDYREKAEGLEAYPDAVSRIQALWPSADVMTVIDDSIFRRPGSEGGAPFSLEAYRELLLLHNIASEITGGAAPAHHDGPTAVSPSVDYSDLGVDIDLDLDAPEASQPPAPPPAPGRRDEHLLDFELDPEITQQIKTRRDPRS